MLAFLIPSSSCCAAAWVLNKGEVKIINSLHYYKSRYFIDADGGHHRQGTFTKYEYTPYTEIGLSKKTTLGFNPRFTYAMQRSRMEKAALTDAEIFLRFLGFKKGGFVYSTQYLLKLPGFYNDEEAQLLGGRTTDIEQRMLFGYNFSAFRRQHFVNLEAAYRYRDIASDELRLDGTLGIRFADKWQWLEQIFVTYAYGALPQIADTTISNTMDYRLVKLQSSVLYDINDRVSLQIGMAQDVFSRNTGKGAGVMTALWVRF